MDAVYPATASALARGRRLRRGPQRARTRTQPVTFAEIKEVDEDSELSEQCAAAGGVEERRRRDELGEGAGGGAGAGRGGELPELPARRNDCRRRRNRTHVIPEPPEEGGSVRAASEPRPAPGQ